MDTDALIRAIEANPADNLPKLVYADYLDKHGRAEEAAWWLSGERVNPGVRKTMQECWNCGAKIPDHDPTNWAPTKCPGCPAVYVDSPADFWMTEESFRACRDGWGQLGQAKIGDSRKAADSHAERHAETTYDQLRGVDDPGDCDVAVIKDALADTYLAGVLAERERCLAILRHERVNPGTIKLVEAGGGSK